MQGADLLQVTEGGIRQKIKGWGRGERQVAGFGKGKAVSWNRRQTTTYSQLRTNKGALQSWKHRLGKAEDSRCRYCEEGKAEAGDHIMFECMKWENLRRKVWIEEEHTVRRCGPHEPQVAKGTISMKNCQTCSIHSAVLPIWIYKSTHTRKPNQRCSEVARSTH